MIKELPLIGMGTWMSEDKQELHETIKAGMEAGYKHIDTAQVYDNERQIGEVLKEIGKDREDLYITSKVYSVNFPNHTTESVMQSLKRLQIDKIDLMLLHSPFRPEFEVKAYKELMALRDKGLIRHIGVSNFPIEKLKALHEATGEWPYCNQIVVAPTFRAEELEAFCKEKGILLTGYSIMKPYFAPSPFYKNSGMSQEQKDIVDAIAKKHGKDAGQVLNKWALQLGYHVIPKSSKASRVVSNFQLMDFELNSEEMESLSSMNKETSESYAKLIASWTAAVTDEQIKNGLLFEENFKPENKK